MCSPQLFYQSLGDGLVGIYMYILQMPCRNVPTGGKQPNSSMMDWMAKLPSCVCMAHKRDPYVEGTMPSELLLVY